MFKQKRISSKSMYYIGQNSLPNLSLMSISLKLFLAYVFAYVIFILYCKNTRWKESSFLLV